jgi:exodeoxyribonuclease (lambda-induced)
MEQRSEGWHLARKGRITASKVGKILGLSSFGTRDDAMREFVREFFDAEREFTGNEATRYGEAHEADALAEYVFATSRTVESVSLIPHPAYDWLAASPDGLVGDDGLVEFKCPWRSQYRSIVNKPEYLAQVQLQLACTDRQWCDFCIWRDGEPLIVERIAADPSWLARVLPELEAFMADWRMICGDADLAAPYLAPKERTDTAWRQAAAAYKRAADNVKLAEAEEKAAREALLALAPEGGKGCGVTVSKAERTGSIAYAKAIKDLLPGADLSAYQGKPTTYYQVRTA